MARDLEEIQASILLKKSETESLNALEVLTTVEKDTLAGLTSSSKVAIWRLWVFIMAFAIWTFESLLDVFEEQINALIALNKIHTPQWYRERILEFQFGFEFDRTVGAYVNDGLETSEVLASQIISSASVEELAGTLKMKIAKRDSQQLLSPLTTEELAAFAVYIQKVKDAGTRLQIISRIPDDLRLQLDICFDPLVLNGQGERLDGTNDNPVGEAINNYLYNLEFNGEFVVDEMQEALKAVEGIIIVQTEISTARFGTNDFEDVDKTYISDAGYMVLDTDNSLIKYSPRAI